MLETKLTDGIPLIKKDISKPIYLVKHIQQIPYLLLNNCCCEYYD